MTNGIARGDDIAVIGAAGKTGEAVVAALSSSVNVRRLVRRARTDSEFEVELETGGGLRKALVGCRGVYFIAPNVHPDEPALLRNALTAAASAGVEHFVYHSVAWPFSPAMPHHLDKAKCEDELHRSPLKWTVLQPCAYAQNFEAVLNGESDRILLPYSADTRFSFVSLGDVAAVAAAVLVEGAAVHHGATYEVGGPQALSVMEVAQIVEKKTSRTVTVDQISLSQWRDEAGNSLDVNASSRLAAMFDFYNHHDFLAGSAAVQLVLGRPPVGIESLVK
ncbi:NmrA family NAD(P)-binding protein [Rhodococcus sp. NPDC056743]|uniref:NmrA family NAD(P)-binding protein n=1 Tax=Rhodococcus sp. NPDC056743 TaxID=3345934 RepID=UPI0036717977